MDEEQEFDAPEDQVGGVEAEVPEDDSENAEGDDTAEISEDGDEEEQDNGEPQRTQSRANTRIRTLSIREKEAAGRAEKAEKEVSDLRRQMEEVQRSLHAGNAVRDSQAEQELLAQMDPVQRVAYEADKKFNALNAEMNRVKLSALDSTDRADFLSKAQNDPVRSRLAEQVEKNLADMRSKGINAPREDIYAYLLGKDFIAQKNKSGGKNPDKQAAKARINETQGRSSSVRGDTSSGRKGKSAEDRLADILL
jgi:hypothetical protein